ncbi:Multiple inositol polyphosphate phosphatase 1 [Pseudolycoriella hygida]|uniref:Multiple inositol polyphosphate phosphatase 1 n=1 Tax=Pseudolycoriella hygida TaxID=35572 RepID=A0A9Q0N0X2_9DIPT|nr:Multiple inositol polyphosphate phosphatase 1 [Pseudolycoriella hygida]
MISSPVIVCVLFACCCIFASINAQRQPGQCCEEYCYDTDSEKPQSRQFATKSAYQIIKGSDNRRQFIVPNCNPVKFWFVGRHGTRLPTVNTIKSLRELVDLRDEVIDNYEKRRTKPDFGALCPEDIEILKNWHWNPNITGDYAQFLTSQGWQDLYFLAKNYQSSFPNVLENIYTPEKFHFRHTHSQRTEASFKAFVDGLFGEGADEHVNVLPKTNPDLLLKPYDACNAYKENEQRQAGPDSEYAKFENSDIYKQTIYEVSARLGFKFSLTPKQIKSIWDMCRFDLAWNLERTSPWCIAFTQNHVKVLEYHEDLKYYYKNSYGAGVNTRLTCSLVVDMLNQMESQALPNVVAYFTHSATFQLFLTALGAAKDNDGLRADNYDTQQRRMWKSSELSPFAANLAVIKYECPRDTERNKIMFFLNQKPLHFDWCNVGLCDWSKVQQRYSSFKQTDCLTTYCVSGSGSNIMPGITVAVTGSLLRYVF